MQLPKEWIYEAKKFLSEGFSQSSKSVVVLGDLGWDKFVWGSVDRISPEAPVAVLKTDKEIQKPGLAANVAENLVEFSQKWKVPVHVTGVLGKDTAGAQMEKHFKDLGPTYSAFVAFDSERPTTLKTRFLAGAHHQLLRVDQESHDTISPEIEGNIYASLEKVLPQAACLVMQDYAKGLFPKNFFQKVVKLAQKNNVRVITDPNMRSAPENYRGVDLITPNVNEAGVLLGRSLGRGDDNDLIKEAALELKSKFDFKTLLLTRSAYGMTWLNEKNEVTHYPAIARSVFDVTGAGDTVVAVLAAALARGASVNVACILAMSAASVVVGKVGTATASFAEIEHELELLEKNL